MKKGYKKVKLFFVIFILLFVFTHFVCAEDSQDIGTDTCSDCVMGETSSTGSQFLSIYFDSVDDPAYSKVLISCNVLGKINNQYCTNRRFTTYTPFFSGQNRTLCG